MIYRHNENQDTLYIKSSFRMIINSLTQFNRTEIFLSLKSIRRNFHCFSDKNWFLSVPLVFQDISSECSGNIDAVSVAASVIYRHDLHPETSDSPSLHRRPHIQRRNQILIKVSDEIISLFFATSSNKSNDLSPSHGIFRTM